MSEWCYFAREGAPDCFGVGLVIPAEFEITKHVDEVSSGGPHLFTSDYPFHSVSFLEQISHDRTSAASSNSHRTVHIYFGVGHQPVQGTISELQSLTGGPRDQGKGQLTPEAPLLE